MESDGGRGRVPGMGRGATQKTGASCGSKIEETGIAGLKDYSIYIPIGRRRKVEKRLEDIEKR